MSLGLKLKGKKEMIIMIFGSSEAKQKKCQSICVGIRFGNGDSYEDSALMFPLITDSLAVAPIQLSMRNYSHLSSL